jgi:hypothetical protein
VQNRASFGGTTGEIEKVAFTDAFDWTIDLNLYETGS